jgi:hypothetical protein
MGRWVDIDHKQMLFDFFEENREHFLKIKPMYKKYLAIKQFQVIDFDKDRDRLAERIESNGHHPKDYIFRFLVEKGQEPVLRGHG